MRQRLRGTFSLIGGGEHLLDGRDSRIYRFLGSSEFLHDEWDHACICCRVSGGEEWLQLIGFAAEADDHGAGKICVSDEARDGSAKLPQAFAVVFDTAAEAVCHRNDAVDIGILVET